MATNKSNVIQLGGDYYQVDICIYSFAQNLEPFNVPCRFINQLVIEETLNNWDVKGYITLESYGEVLERGALNENGDFITPPLLLRNDARNKISINLKPCLTRTRDGSAPDFANVPPEWTASFDCVIYDVQDVSTNNPEIKLRTFYFRDERYQILSERNLEWSTSKELKANPMAKDAEKTISGNEIIKKLLTAAASVGAGGTTKLKVGFNEKGSINEPNLDLDMFSSEWDVGPPDPESKLLYTSPANSSALSDINYILQNTKSSDGSPVILDYGRQMNNKMWQLYSFKKLFENSSTKQVEWMIIHDGVEPGSGTPSIPRADTQNLSNINNFQSGIASKILKYEYSPMAPLDDSRFLNTAVHGYDNTKGEYKIHFEKNSLSKLLSETKSIAAGLYTKGENLKLNVNKTKSSSIAFRNVYRSERYFLPDQALMKNIKDFIFLNDAVFLQLPGLTLRSPGKFIYIDRKYYLDSKFDDKFLGQWLITKVSHIFTKDTYINDIIATKIDSAKALWPENDAAY